MGNKIELTPEVFETLQRYKAGMLYKPPWINDDNEVVNRALKRYFASLEYHTKDKHNLRKEP